MKKFRCCHITILAFIFSNTLSGCYTSNPVTRSSAYSAAIERARKDKRHLIMHSGVDVYTITSVEVEKAKKQFTVQLNKVDSLHMINIKNRETLPNKANKSEQAALREVHLYMRDSTSYTLDEPHTILLDKVARIERVN